MIFYTIPRWQTDSNYFQESELMGFSAIPGRFFQGFLIAALLAALSACGGGGDGGGDNAAPVVVGTPATTAPNTGAVSGIDRTGNINYLVYRVNTAGTGIESVMVPGTVTMSGTNGTLTFDYTPVDLSVTTTNAWAGVSWPSGFSGRLLANGNVGMVCDTDPRSTTGQVGVSHNMLRVSDAGVLKGKTLKGYDCDSVDYTAVFNADGTASITDVDGTFQLTASQVTAAFSSAGVIFSDGSKVQLAIYKTSTAPTKYFVVDQYTGTGVDGDLSGVELMAED